MDARKPTLSRLPRPPAGGRQHRYMESSDINAAFRTLFGPLRSNIRRGMTNEGQIYGLEMDPCVPGEVLGTVWIPLATRGIAEPAQLADTRHRRRLFRQLLSEARPEALYAYVCERPAAAGQALLYVELVSADATCAAEYPIRPGTGWRRRDMLEVPHRRLARGPGAVKGR